MSDQRVNPLEPGPEVFAGSNVAYPWTDPWGPCLVLQSRPGVSPCPKQYEPTMLQLAWTAAVESPPSYGAHASTADEVLGTACPMLLTARQLRLLLVEVAAHWYNEGANVLEEHQADELLDDDDAHRLWDDARSGNVAGFWRHFQPRGAAAVTR